MIGDELRGAEVAKLGAVDDDEAVRISPRAPRRLDHAAHVVGMIVCAGELDSFLPGRCRIAAQAHFANGERECAAKRIRIGGPCPRVASAATRAGRGSGWGGGGGGGGSRPGRGGNGGATRSRGVAAQS